MTTGAEVEVRAVVAADRCALERFSCRALAHPWTDEVERTIHCLADELEQTGTFVARGLWACDELRAVVAWRLVPQTTLCQSIALAVQTGYRRRGYGRTLKQLELDAAWQARCSSVISQVHRNNHSMMTLNRSLGAKVEPIDQDYAYCIIPAPTTPGD